MQLDIRTKLFFGALLVITPTFYDTALLDMVLVSRFVCLSVVLLAGVFLFLKEISEVKQKYFTSFEVFFLTYFIISALSVLWSLNHAEAIFHLQKIFAIFLVYLVTRFLLKRTKEEGLRTVFFCNTFTTIIVIGVLLWQFVNAHAISDEILRNQQITGLSANKNQAASFLYMLLIINLLSVVYFHKMARAVSISIIVVQTVVLLLLQTRGVYVAIFLSGLFLLLIASKNIIKSVKITNLVGTFVFIIILCSISIYVLGERFDLDSINVTKYIESSSAHERIHVWKKTIGLIKKEPLTGVGIGNWSTYFPSRSLAEISVPNRIYYQRPHNDFLWVFSEIGVLGGLAYIGIFASLFLSGFKALKFTTTYDRLGICIILAGLLGYIIISNFSFPKERIEHQIWLVLFFAIIAFYTRDNFNKIKFNNRVFIAIALVGLSANLIIGYYRYEGEKYTKQFYKKTIDIKLKKSLVEQASSCFYNLDHTGTPLQWHMGVIANNEFDTALALAYFKEAYQLSPYNYRVLNDLAGCYGRLGNNQKLETYLFEAYRINPDYIPTIYNLTIFYFENEAYQESMEMVNKLPYKQYPEIVEMHRKIRTKMKALGIEEKSKK